METLRSLSEKKKQLLKQVQNLSDMRKGSVSKQMVKAKNEDGSPKKRGPYFIYSYKDKNQKTVSRYLPDRSTVARYKRQIEQFRKFEAWRSDFIDVCHQICDLEEEKVGRKKGDLVEKKRRMESSKKSDERSKG